MPSLEREPPQPPKPDRVYEQLDKGRIDVDTTEDLFDTRRGEIRLKAGKFVVDETIAVAEEIEMRRLFYDLGMDIHSYLFGLWEPRQKDEPGAFGDNYDTQKPLGTPAMATFMPVSYTSGGRFFRRLFRISLSQYKQYRVVVTRLRV